MDEIITFKDLQEFIAKTDRPFIISLTIEADIEGRSVAHDGKQRQGGWNRYEGKRKYTDRDNRGGILSGPTVCV